MKEAGGRRGDGFVVQAKVVNHVLYWLQKWADKKHFRLWLKSQAIS